MPDWYRKKTWTKADEEEYFTKLARARENNRAQYLRVQAAILVATGDPKLLDGAESLIEKLFSDYPENKFERSVSLTILGDICKLRKQPDKALEYYKAAMEFEEIYPNVQTSAYLDFSELVVKLKKQEYYEFAEDLLVKRVDSSGFVFPNAGYKAFSLLAIFSHYKGNKEMAKQFAALAEKNASAETSGLRYHKSLGVVTNRDDLLDFLMTGGE
jgi:tetratricopeptide (TPR) repeat protein